MTSHLVIPCGTSHVQTYYIINELLTEKHVRRLIIIRKNKRTCVLHTNIRTLQLSRVCFIRWNDYAVWPLYAQGRPHEWLWVTDLLVNGVSIKNTSIRLTIENIWNQLPSWPSVLFRFPASSSTIYVICFIYSISTSRHDVRHNS